MRLKSKESHPADLNNSMDKYIMGINEENLPKVPDDIPTLREYLNTEENHCPYCNKPCDKFAMDEIIPCMFGGRYKKDGGILNMIEVCIPCNCSKGNKIGDKLIKWIKNGPVLGESRIPIENQEKFIAWLEKYQQYLCSDDPIIRSKIEEMHSENKLFFEIQKQKALTPCILSPKFDDSIQETTTTMKKTGKQRILTDQFYTNPDVSLQCIDLFLRTIKINENDILLEPSAGNGSFSNYLIQKPYRIDAYDIDPKCDYIQQQDFLEFDVNLYKDKNVHCIGNPPFGRQSSLAKKFIKKLTLFCDTVSFILPKSFRKQSYQKTFPLNYHLIEEIELGKNAFIIDGKPHNVACIFQIWVKKDTERFVEPEESEEGFHFVKKPELKNIEMNDEGHPIQKENIFTEEPDFGILRAGGGRTCGRISLDYKNGILCYPEAWLFIKLDDKYDKDVFYSEYQKINWIDDSNVGARSIDKQTFIKGINSVLAAIGGG